MQALRMKMTIRYLNPREFWDGHWGRRSQALNLLNPRCSGPLGARVGFTTERSRRLSGLPMKL